MAKAGDDAENVGHGDVGIRDLNVESERFGLKKKRLHNRYSGTTENLCCQTLRVFLFI